VQATQWFCRSQGPRGLKRTWSWTAPTLTSWVRVRLDAWMCIRVSLYRAVETLRLADSPPKVLQKRLNESIASEVNCELKQTRGPDP